MFIHLNLFKIQVSELLKNRYGLCTLRPRYHCDFVVSASNQLNYFVYACLDALVSVLCAELIVAVCCGFLALIRCCVEDNYMAEIPTTTAMATHDNNLGVVHWGYSGELAWNQDVLRHLDELPCSCRILD